MYPDIRLPRPPPCIITDRLDVRAQPPIGVASDYGGLQFNSDVMHHIIRMVALSGGRQSTCFLSQVHPYFFRETDQARVHAYFETQIARLNAGLPFMEFQARFTAMLGAMHAAAGRLPVENRLYFLVHLADRVMFSFSADQGLRQNFRELVIDAGKSLGLGPQEGMCLFMAVMAGCSDIPDNGPLQLDLFHRFTYIPTLLEKAAWLPGAERHALGLMDQVMADEFDGYERNAAEFATDILLQASTWPHAWRVGLLNCIARKLNTFTIPTRLELAPILFAKMSELPVGQRPIVLRALAMYVQNSLYYFFQSSGSGELLGHLPQWLSACKTFCGWELDVLNTAIGHAFIDSDHEQLSRKLQPKEEAEIDALATALIALNLSIPAGPGRVMPTGLLAFVAQFVDTTERAATFKQLWHRAVVSNGLFRSMHESFRTLMASSRNAPEIVTFLFEQFMLLPAVERNMIALSVCLLHQPTPLRADVAYAIVDHLPSIPAAIGARVMSMLLDAVRCASYTRAGSINPRWPARNNRINSVGMQEVDLERIQAQILSLNHPERGVTLADLDGIVQRLTSLLPTMGDKVIERLLLGLKYWHDSTLLTKSYRCALDSAKTMPASSQKLIALQVLPTVLNLIADAKLIDSSLTDVVKQAFHLVSRLPSTFRADALYTLCRLYQESEIQKSVWGGLFDFVVAELVTLPMQERGRLLHILAECTDLSSPQGMQSHALLEHHTALLDPASRNAWLLLIKLAAVDPEGANPDREYAAFLDLKALCAGMDDLGQLATVKSRIATLDAVFKKNRFSNDDTR